MKKNSGTEAFENVKDQIGRCGIWCGSCIMGNGTLRELTKRYDGLIKAYALAEWGPKDFDFAEFSKGLASIQNMPLCPGCLQGGGKENCEMKACTTNKNLNDCTECNKQESCKHIDILNNMRSGALNVGIFVKTEDVDRSKLIANWTADLKNSWPCCTLFIDGH